MTKVKTLKSILALMFLIFTAGIVSAGPNQWTLTEGMYPIGGYHMSLCPSDNNIIYATGGYRLSPQYLYKSVDRGNTWSQVSNVNVSWYYVYAAPEDSSTIYLIDGIRPGVYKSTDGGNTASYYTTGISSTARITDLCITDTTGTLLLGGRFVYKSTDDGETWSPASTGMGNVGDIKLSVSPVNSSLIYATGGNSLYKTIDGGSTWSLKTTGLPELTYLDIATVPGDGSTLFITSPNINGGVYISTDTGETWQEMNNGFSPYPPYIVKLLVIPGKSPIILAATDKGIYSYTLTTTSVDKKQWELYEEKE